MKLERNILERVQYLLKLENDKEFKTNLYTFLDAAATKEEADESKKALCNTIATKLYSEFYTVVREQPNGEQLLNKFASLSKGIDLSDEDFNDLLKSVENVLKPAVKGTLNEKFDVVKLIDVANEIESTTAFNLLNEYNNETANINKLTSAIEEIAYTIKTKAVISREDRKLTPTMKVYIDGIYELMGNIKEYIELGNSGEVSKGLKEFAKLSHKAFGSIGKEAKKTIDNDPVKKDPVTKTTSNSKPVGRLTVNITDGLSNILKNNALSKHIRLNRERKAKKKSLVKPLVIAASIIAVMIGSTLYIIHKNSSDKEEIKKDPIVTDVPNNPDNINDLLFDMTSGFVRGTRIYDQALVGIAKNPEDDSKEKDEENNKDNATSNQTISTATPVPSVEPAVTPTPVVTPEPEVTPEPIITPEPEEEPAIDNETMNKVNSAASVIYNNWSMISGYGYDDIVELIKCLNGLESSMSIGTVDSILLDVLNAATVDAVNNAIAGEQVFITNTLNFSSLLISDQGYTAVKAMENNLNGALTDSGNLAIYRENTLTDEAIVANNGVTGGIGMYSGNPAARLIWSRLAIGTNAIISTLGSDYSITLDGVTYTMSDLTNAGIYESIAQSAKQELGNQFQK